MIGISNLVAADDNAGGRNNPDHNTSHETTGPGDKRRSRGNGDGSRVEKTSLQVAEANSKDVGRRIAKPRLTAAAAAEAMRGFGGGVL